MTFASFDEALTIVEFGMKVSSPQVNVARQTISGYLSSLQKVGLRAERQVPPVPSLSLLRDAKLFTVGDRF